MRPFSHLSDNSVVCLMAPTASGKTALAYELYDTGQYELISVDSALIYRDMDIGTAKPTASELEHYPHHLVDIIDPTQTYSVAQFVVDIQRLIKICHQKGKIPLLVGGTMMYYMALIDGLSPVPDSDADIRSQVDEWRQVDGIEALYEYLAQVDPETHKRLKPADTQRITRAIEVYKQTQIPISDWQRQPKHAIADNPEQQWHIMTIMPNRSWLHQRIAQRLEMMWQEGLVEEVIGLLSHYALTPNMPAMRCVGYRQVLEYLVRTQHPILNQSHLMKDQFLNAFDHDPDYAASLENQRLACDDMQNKALYATRQLAKRQFTWLRKINKLPHAKSFDSMSQAKEYLIK